MFNKAAALPFVSFMLEAEFTVLRNDPPSALVAGSADQPWKLRGSGAVRVLDRHGFHAFNDLGYVLIATSFECEPDGDGTRLSTETRVQPADERAAKRFRP